MFKVFFAALSSALAPFLLRLLSPLVLVGVGFLVFDAVFRSLINKLQQMAMSHLLNMPPDIRTFVFMTGINDAVSIMFSAFITALSIKAFKAVAMTKSTKYTQPWNGF